MYRIQANKSATRWIEVSDDNLRTIRKYSLFQWLVDSNGIVTETALDKLRLNVRSLLTSAGTDRDLIDLCIDVLYHKDMKSLGLENLLVLYENWSKENPEHDEIPEK
ncbi:MAG: hypothetical protein J5732_06445 [Bacteroidaceae bacterium]|nr:hypothetical protein [Bacteroidaceae bacterium]